MTRDESLDVVKMILTHWRVHDWGEEEIDVFAKSIQYLDAEIATSTVITSSKELKFPPRIAEFHERYRTERKRLRPAVDPKAEPEATPLPLWVKRWICARQLYALFGKERDMRRFHEQGDYGDLTQELMPEGAWVEEANGMGDEEVMKKWRKAMTS